MADEDPDPNMERWARDDKGDILMWDLLYWDVHGTTTGMFTGLRIEFADCEVGNRALQLSLTTEQVQRLGAHLTKMGQYLVSKCAEDAKGQTIN